MESKVVDSSDLSLFLKELASELLKEGAALQSLNKAWGIQGEEAEILRRYGLNISSIGRRLLVVKDILCQKCKMREVTIIIKVEESSDEKDIEKKEQNKK